MSNRIPSSHAVPAEARSEFRRLTPMGRNREITALMSKLVPDANSQRFGQTHMTNNRRNQPMQAPDMGLLHRISDLTANDVSDAQSIFQLLPETELAMQILVSSILAPKDLVTTSVNFGLEANRFNSELAGQMLNVVTDHFEKIYKISDLLKPCLQDALFLTGSYPLLILPENTIDRAINNPGRISMEAMKHDFTSDGNPINYGFLGNPDSKKLHSSGLSFGLESWGDEVKTYKPKVAQKWEGIDPLLTVVDNFNILKLTQLQRRIAQDRTYQILGRRHATALRGTGHNVSQEAYSSLQASQENYSAATSVGRIGAGGVQVGNYQHQPIQMLSPSRDLNRPTVGHPLVMKLPSESVIPVHQPSNPEKHLGYFIMLDQMGNPLNSAQRRDYYTDMSNSLNSNSSMSSQLLAQAKRSYEGQSVDRQAEIDEMARIYGQFLEKELTDRLRNGIYGNQVEITAPEEVYRVMLARAMNRQQTQVLYVPAEMLTYIAFDYNKYGIGQSLLQASKILGGIRVVSFMAEAVGSIKNAINRTRLGITLDPEDPNPTQTVEFMITEYAKTRQGAFPLGATNPTDIVSYLQNASVDIEVSGNTRYPDTKMEITERQSNRIKPEESMVKELRDRHLMAMGLSPDMVDAGQGAEFATSVLANNLLLAKRVLIYQNQLETFLSDFVKKYILADGYLMDAMRKLINDNRSKLTKDQQDRLDLSKQAAVEKDALNGRVSTESINQQLESLEDMQQDALIMEFLQCLLISLPKPDMATIKSQMEAYDQQDQAYEKALDAYINDSYLEAHGLGTLHELVAPTKAAVKAELMRNWMRDNNVMPELHDLLAGEEDERPDILKNMMEHFKSMGDSLLKIMYQFAIKRGRWDPAVEKLSKLVGADAGAGDFGGGFDAGGGTDAFAAPDPLGDVGGMDTANVPEIPDNSDAVLENEDGANTDNKDPDETDGTGDLKL
jgi:hypothetical protein